MTQTNLTQSGIPFGPSPIPRNSSVSGAYVHVPFCIHRCGYCDFTVVAGRDDLIGDYLVALEQELKSKLSEPHPVETLFLGGGTPSYLPPADMERLFSLLRNWFPLREGGEFSMECNPDGLTSDRMALMRDAGVNRISLGVQSFEAGHLQTLERTHTAEEVEEVVGRLRDHGFENVSFDLIFGVPHQTLPQWEETLATAVRLAPQHISTYGLTYEKGTSFWTRLQRDQIHPVPEELEREMYEMAMTFLPERGYRQYELSNFAQPGFECRHNQMYWRAEPFFGIGPGAAEFLNGVRQRNHRSVTVWIERLKLNRSPVQEVDELDADLMAREAVMVGLRQTAGIPLAAFEEKYGISVRDLAAESFDQCIEKGWLEEENGHVRLTFEGRFVADSVMAEFF